MRKDIRLSAGFCAVAMLFIIAASALTTIFFVPGNNVYADSEESFTITLGSGESYNGEDPADANHAHLSYACTQGEIVSSSIVSVSGGGSAACISSQGSLDVDVYASRGNTFSSPVTVTVSVVYSSSEHRLESNRIGIQYEYVVPPTSTPTPTNTPSPTPAPTSRPTTTVAPTERPTTTPRPVAATPTPNPNSNTNTTTPAVTTAAATETVAPVVVTETTAPVAPDVTETTLPSETSEETTATTEESTEETEITEETTEAALAAVVAETTAPTNETTQADSAEKATPTPTPFQRIQHAAGIEVKKDEKSFPWWIVIALLALCGFRYYTLNQVESSKKDIFYNFIPGGIIGTIAEKIHPSPTPVNSEPEPELVNGGYLKKSDIAPIRPVYSNAASTRPASNRGVNKTPVGGVNKTSSASTPAAKPEAQKTSEKPSAPVAGTGSHIKRPRSSSAPVVAPVVTKTETKVEEPKKSEEKKPENPKTEVKKTEPKKTEAKKTSNSRGLVKRPKNEAFNRPNMSSSRPSENRVAENRVSEKKVEESGLRKPTAVKDEESTMNRPDATVLNVNASNSAASIVFKKEQKEDKEFAPAIATAILPPVQEKKDERPSPFKSNGMKAERLTDEDLKVEGKKPGILDFKEIPLVEKPASPFKPIPPKDDSQE